MTGERCRFFEEYPHGAFILHNKKLLLVDEEPELLKMVTAILADDGFLHLITAANMKEGLAAAKNEKPDLAILDVTIRLIKNDSRFVYLYLPTYFRPDSIILLTFLCTPFLSLMACYG